MQFIDTYVTPYYVINKKEWIGSKNSFYKCAHRLLQNSIYTLNVIRKHPIGSLVCIKKEKSNFLAKMSYLGAQESYFEKNALNILQTYDFALFCLHNTNSS